MTLRPTKKNQQEWIRKYLNNGICPDDAMELPLESACMEAMEWLEQQDDIHTLADAWDKCPYPEWLGWMYTRMEPSVTDAKNWWGATQKALEVSGYSEQLLISEDYYINVHVIYSMKKGETPPSVAIEEMCTYWIFDVDVDGCETSDLELNKIADVFRAHIPNPWKFHRKKNRRKK